MFWYNVISHNPSYYFKMYISEITKKKKKQGGGTCKFVLNSQYTPFIDTTVNNIA